MIELLIFFLVNTIIAFAIAIPLGFLHEYLHVREAKKQGCTIEKYDKRHNEIIVKGDEDPAIAKRIKDAPYKIIIPLSIILLIVGLGFLQLGLIMGSVGTLLIHAVSYRLEGKADDRHKSKSN